MIALPKIIYTSVIPKGKANIPELAGVRDTQPVKFRSATPTGEIDRYDHALDTVPYVFYNRSLSFGLTVDNDAPPLSDEKAGDILYCSLESPVVRRDTMSTQYSYSLLSRMTQWHVRFQVLRL
jgi:hypothetical protein